MREQWLQEQFSTIAVNDKRLRRRAVDIAIGCAEQPEESLAGRFDDWADLKATYRFFSHPKITNQVLQQPHWHQVLEKARWSEEIILFIQGRWTTIIERYFMVKLKRVRDFWRSLARLGGFIAEVSRFFCAKTRF